MSVLRAEIPAITKSKSGITDTCQRVENALAADSMGSFVMLNYGLVFIEGVA